MCIGDEASECDSSVYLGYVVSYASDQIIRIRRVLLPWVWQYTLYMHYIVHV